MNGQLKYIARLVQMEGKSKKPSKEYLATIAGIFKTLGGSWLSIYKGDVDQIILLKNLVKVSEEIGLNEEC